MSAESTRLMLATKSGDRRAFDELVRRLRGRAFHVAHSLVGSREDAMDLSQEAFLRQHTGHGQLELGRGAGGFPMPRLGTVANPGEHVSDRVGEHESPFYCWRNGMPRC
jgi:hypothetical protein